MKKTKRMTGLKKRLLAVALTFIMLVTVVPVYAAELNAEDTYGIAEAVNTGEETIQAEEPVEDTEIILPEEGTVSADEISNTLITEDMLVSDIEEQQDTDEVDILSLETVSVNEIGDVIENEGYNWQEPAENWYEDYDYTRDDKNKKLYIRKVKESAIGKISGYIVIPATVTIKGENYNVVFKQQKEAKSPWYSCSENLYGIKLLDGIVIEDSAYCLFAHLYYVEEIDLGDIDSSTVTDMTGMFCDDSAIERITNLDKLDTQNVTTMLQMFDYLQALTSVNLANFNTSKVTDMTDMFRYCNKLQEIDCSSFDTSNVTSMMEMFAYCTSAKTIKVSSFDTSSVTDLERMFEHCEEMTTVDVTGFNTENAEDMTYMFYGCAKLSVLDVRSFDFRLANVTEFGGTRGFFGKHADKNSGVKTLYLPVNAMTDFSYSNVLTTIYYAGTEAQWNALNITIPVGVTMHYEQTEAMTGLNLKETLSVAKGSSVKLRPLPIPGAAEIKGFKYSVDVKTVIRIKENTNKDGIVNAFYITGLKEGTAVVTVTTVDDKFSKECTVTVTPAVKPGPDPGPEPISHDYVESITLDSSSFTLSEDKTKLIKATLAPKNANDTTVLWESSNDAIVSVDDDGLVTAYGEGTAVITATAKGAEPGTTVSASCVVKVKGSQILDIDEDSVDKNEGFWLTGINTDGYVYTGAKIKPEFRLYYGTMLLKSGTDYKVTYKNNKAVSVLPDGGALYDSDKAPGLNRKAPQIKIKLKGNYKGTLVRTFSINKKDLGDGDIIVVNASGILGKKALKIKPLLYYRGKAIPGSQYTYSGDGWNKKGYKEAGIYDVDITAAESGSFTGTTAGKVIIKEGKGMLNLSKLKPVTVDGKTSYTYTGGAIEPDYVIYKGKKKTELVQDEDFTVSFENNINKGTATVRIMASESSDKCYGTLTAKFKIVNSAAIALNNNPDVDIKLLDETGHEMDEPFAYYLKGGVKPKVRLTVTVDSVPVILREGIDYKLSYKKNKKATDKADATVTATGKGAYKGSVELKFAVKRQSLSRLKLVVDDVVLNPNLKKQKAYSYQKTSWKLTDLNGKTLASGKDFNAVKKGSKKSHGKSFIADSDKLNVGDIVTLRLTAKPGSNYSGSICGSYKVITSSQSIKKAKITLTDEAKARVKYADGMPIELSEDDLKVMINKRTRLDVSEYEIVGFTGNLQAGKKAKVTIRGINGHGGLKTATFTIGPRVFRNVPLD